MCKRSRQHLNVILIQLTHYLILFQLYHEMPSIDHQKESMIQRNIRMDALLYSKIKYLIKK
jgi:hypothetical protein